MCSPSGPDTCEVADPDCQDELLDYTNLPRLRRVYDFICIDCLVTSPLLSVRVDSPLGLPRRAMV